MFPNRYVMRKLFISIILTMYSSLVFSQGHTIPVSGPGGASIDELFLLNCDGLMHAIRYRELSVLESNKISVTDLSQEEIDKTFFNFLKNEFVSRSIKSVEKGGGSSPQAKCDCKGIDTLHALYRIYSVSKNQKRDCKGLAPRYELLDNFEIFINNNL